VQTTADLREGFLSFFEEKGHLRCPSASLIPRADDHSTLLTSAGMQPQMPFFLGREAPPAPTTTTAQKVFRTVDIDEVGLDTYHLTFFEMMGNFSFGQYFKQGAIEYATEFIRERLRLDWDSIWVSVHAGDPELKLGPDQEAITRLLTETIEQIAQDDKSFSRAKIVFTESDERCGLTAELDGVKKEGVPLQIDLEQLEDAQTQPGARAQLKEALRLYFRRVMGTS